VRAVTSYAFGAGRVAAERLAVVHEVFVPLADQLLDDAVVTVPRRVVDLGCGPGHTTRFLAQRWPAAAVTGVDAATPFVAAARALVPSAVVIEGDVTDPTILPAGSADVVYARCVLAHLADVPAAIHTWRRWLAPHGRLVLEEPERIETDDAVFRRYLRATDAAVAARGATMFAGPLVHAATQPLDNVVIDRVAIHPVTTGDAATMFALNLATIGRDPAAGLDEAEIAALQQALTGRRADRRTGVITWHVRQAVIGAEACI
jgi:SAM-dependent methyltransferase